MAEPPREPSLGIEQRRALALLASIPHGIIEDLLVLNHEVDRAAIAGLVQEGLATAGARSSRPPIARRSTWSASGSPMRAGGPS